MSAIQVSAKGEKVDKVKLRNMYLGAPVNRYYLPDMTFEDDKVIITMDVRQDFFHAAKAMHGSVYFKMLDDAAWFAVCAAAGGYLVLTADFTVNFIRPVTGGKVVAEGRAIPQGGKLFIGNAELFDEDGRLVGLGRGAFSRRNRKLTEELGYK